MPTVDGLRLPPARLRFMQEDDAALVSIGSMLARDLYDLGLGPGDRLLDVGSGYGRLAIGLRATGYAGEYVGFDILEPHVSWCRRRLADDRYRFRHLDVHNDRYNPTGAIDAAHARFPAAAGRFDACCLFSVFTHMYRADIERYLTEIRRVLRPGGWAATSWFLFDEARIPFVTSSDAAYPLVHELDATCRFESADDPLKAIGYDQAAMEEMVTAAGLQVRQVRRGTWAGDLPRRGIEGFQDLVVVQKRGATEQPAASGLRRATRWARVARRRSGRPPR